VRPRLLALALVILGTVFLLVRGLGGAEDAGRTKVPPATVPVEADRAGEQPDAEADAEADEPFLDPYAYDPSKRRDFERRAARGTAHPIYAFSPGGVQASAQRTARFRPQIERAAAQAGVSADRLEGLVLLESAGRTDAIAGGGTELKGAVGLTQILAETGQNLLGMEIDVDRSERLTRQIARAQRRGRSARAERLRRIRAQADQRFDPQASLAATARYLTISRERFGREDLGFVAYHMGIGNLEGVVRAYTGADADTPIDEVVRDADLTYAQLYFDSTPRRHPTAQRRLAALGDDSQNYYWKVLAAREILRLHREDPEELARRAALHGEKNSAEELLHPAGETERFRTPKQLAAAWRREAIVAFPDEPARLGLARSRQMGELARRLGQRPSLYQGLRPEALALAIYLGAQVRAASGDPASLIFSSTVRDDAYQGQLIRGNGEATRKYSLHTTGYAFDVLRRYGSGRQARAFQFQLDRLQVLDVIAWVREPAAIHVTVSEDAERLLPLLDRVSG
jgi:hypothetical protein